MSTKPSIAYIGQKGIANITGGVETHVRELSKRVAAKGHPVTVYVRPYTVSKNTDAVSDMEIKELPSIRTKHLDAISHTFLATMHAIWKGVDIIHYHSIGPSLLAFIPRILRPRTRVIVTFHSIDREHGKWGRVAKSVLRVAEWTALTFPHVTIMTSEANASYARKTYNKPSLAIHTGVVEPTVYSASVIQQQFKLTQGSYILIASRLIPHKNIHLVIEAFKKIKTDLKLVIAGDASYTDAYEKLLRDQAAGDDRILFVGRHDGRVLEELFSNCLFFVNVSDSEGCPTATLEAMAYGKLVLVSDIPVNREVAGEHGMYAERTVKSVAENLKKLIQEKNELPRLHEKIQTYTLEKFDWEDVVTKTVNLYFGLRYCRDADHATQFVASERR